MPKYKKKQVVLQIVASGRSGNRMSALQELRSSRRPKRGDDVCFGAHVVSDRDPIDALRHVGRVEGLVGGVELQSRHQAGGAA